MVGYIDAAFHPRAAYRQVIVAADMGQAALSSSQEEFPALLPHVAERLIRQDEEKIKSAV